VVGKAVRGRQKETRAEKAGLENEAADTKTIHQSFEQREQTNCDRRDPAKLKKTRGAAALA
jgi:hypothetical protein